MPISSSIIPSSRRSPHQTLHTALVQLSFIYLRAGIAAQTRWSWRMDNSWESFSSRRNVGVVSAVTESRPKPCFTKPKPNFGRSLRWAVCCWGLCCIHWYVTKSHSLDFYWCYSSTFRFVSTVSLYIIILTARRHARIASAVLATAIPSVCPSVCHTPVLCQNDGR